ncbi:MAG: pre-peptidase C-terminal domain-containing protein [Actinomycetota bacterium]
MQPFRSTLAQFMRLLLALALFSLMAVGAFAQARGAARTPNSGKQLPIQAGRITLFGKVQAQLLSAPPKAPWQLQRKVDGLDRDGDGMPDRHELPLVPEGPYVGPSGPSPNPPVIIGKNQKEGLGAQANTDSIAFGMVTNLNAAATSNSTSVILEPSTASNGNVVMYTGNWFAAVSTNGGASFSYINPYTTFPPSDGGFCCDQVLQYIPSIDRFIWLLQYVKNGASQNRQRLAYASTAQAAAGQWSFLDITSANLSLANQWLDYPALGVGANTLYLTTNVFNSADNFTRSMAIALPFTMFTSGTTSFSSFSVTDTGSLHPAQNMGTRAYIAAHNSSSSLRVYHWDEGNSPFQHNVTVPSWSSGPYSSTTPGGFNWLARVDSRITAATVVGSEIWVGWTAAAGGAYSRPQPYANIVRVRASDFAFLGDERSIQFGAIAAAAYPSINTNSNGEVAISYAWGGGGTLVPNTAIGFLTGGDRRQYSVTAGTHGPGAQVWGDYLTVRVDGQNAKAFSATGYALVGGTGNANSVPTYFKFGRASDIAGTIQPDTYESDDASGTAKTLNVGETQFRNIHAIGNHDYATFTLATPATVTVATDGEAGDTVMNLYGPNNAATLIETDDDDGNGTFSLINRALTAGTYWVRVEEFNNNSTLPGYSLALTSVIPSVLVTSPNGGETLTFGASHEITWTTANASGNVMLEYSINGGSTWTTISANTADDGSFMWSVPNAPSTQGRVRVSMLDMSATDTSDANFTLLGPSITVVSPNGGETLNIGGNHTITWTSTAVSGNVLLEFSTNGGTTWTTISSSTPNDGSELWTIPNAATSQGRVRVSTLDMATTDQSNANFTIQLPPSSITVTSPNGGESFVAGSTQTISWSSSNVVGNVQLEYSTDGGSTWTTITANTANDGSEGWNVPNIGTVQGRVRVSALTASVSDTSNSNFTILLPTITVTSPNGGEAFPVSTAQTISWTSNNLSGNVKLELSTDGGATWTTLNANTANDGSEGWTTPAAPTSQGRVRVSAVSSSVFDESNANFAVTYTGGILKAPARVNFGTVKNLRPKTKKVVLQNKSKTQSLIVSLATSGAPFTLTSGVGPFTIPAKKKLTVFVSYAPTAPGVHTGTLTVTSSDPIRPIKAITLTGKAR